MKKNKQKIIDLLPFILSILILLVYVATAIHYVPIIEPVMDEGTYLLKGKWYWQNTYQPFEEGGPITNKPPLAFYSLGISQILFSPGLASGRYFAVFLSVLMLTGQWLTVKRLAGKWWATFSIALYALSPAWIIYYSRAMTQVVTSLLIVWSLYFCLGKDRKSYQLMLGAILAAMVVMVRQNLLPLFIFTLLYIIWENGFRKSILPVLGGIFTFIGFNALYWPQIYYSIWQPFFPKFLDSLITHVFHLSSSIGDMGTPFLNREYKPIYQIQVFFDCVRYFFLPVFISLASFIIYSPKDMFHKNENKKVAFLACSFLFLLILHYGYAMMDNDILYSFPAYQAFYLPLGIALIPFVFKETLSWQNKNRYWMLALFIILACTGIGLSLYRSVAAFFMNWNLPSISTRQFFHGPYELWDVLLNRFHISISTQEFVVPAIAGFLAGILIVILAGIFHKIVRGEKKEISYGSALFLVCFLLGIVLSPTFILAANGSIETNADMDIPAWYENIGEELAQTIPEGSLVYWEGYTPIPFLYLPDVKLFPPQLNMYFPYQIGGDPDFLEGRGYWNEELAQKWIKEADILVFNEEAYTNRFLKLDSSLQDDYRLLPFNQCMDPCDGTEGSVVLERIPEN